jgi:hypothetical protein
MRRGWPSLTQDHSIWKPKLVQHLKGKADEMVLAAIEAFDPELDSKLLEPIRHAIDQTGS